jgi:hypothetical protein
MVWQDTVWYGMVGYCMVWYGMAEYCIVCYDRVLYGMVWQDTLWYGRVLYGMVWYGRVLYVCMYGTVLRGKSVKNIQSDSAKNACGNCVYAGTDCYFPASSASVPLHN